MTAKVQFFLFVRTPIIEVFKNYVRKSRAILFFTLLFLKSSSQKCIVSIFSFFLRRIIEVFNYPFANKKIHAIPSAAIFSSSALSEHDAYCTLAIDDSGINKLYYNIYSTIKLQTRPLVIKIIFIFASYYRNWYCTSKTV